MQSILLSTQANNDLVCWNDSYGGGKMQQIIYLLQECIEESLLRKKFLFVPEYSLDWRVAMLSLRLCIDMAPLSHPFFQKIKQYHLVLSRFDCLM